MRPETLLAKDPSPLLKLTLDRLFAQIEVDEEWVVGVREQAKRGPVVYVLRNLSFVDFFALDFVTRRYDLPRIGYANTLGLGTLEPIRRGVVGWFGSSSVERESSELRECVAAGLAAAVFLHRPTSLLGPKPPILSGEAAIAALVDFAKTSKRAVSLVGQVFVWRAGPDAAVEGAIDSIFGSTKWPGRLRSTAQLLAYYRQATLRGAFQHDLATISHAHDGRAAEVVRMLDETLDSERASIVGPPQKPSERIYEEVLASPEVQRLIVDLAGEGEAERSVLEARAREILLRMEASVDTKTVSMLDSALKQVTTRVYSGVDVDALGLERLRQLGKQGTLVLLPSHKSHMDYLMLSQVFFRNHLPVPLIAAGDNLNFFPMGFLFRRAGAFFIRRKFRGDKLYTTVVDAYVRSLIKDGRPMEFFLEGGRSRTGKLLPPKLGLLGMVLDAALSSPEHPVFFCPISIGYERFVEESAFVRELSGGEKSKEDASGLIKSAQIVQGRYGRVNIQFGEPLSLQGFLDGVPPSEYASLDEAARHELRTRIAYRVMNEINRVTCVTGGALVATALLMHDKRGISHEDLVAGCEDLARVLRGFGARFSPTLDRDDGSGEIRGGALRDAIKLFVRAGHVEVFEPSADPSARGPRKGRGVVFEDAIYVVPPERRLSLELSKNLLVHFFVPRAVIATAVAAVPTKAERGSSLVSMASVRARAQWLSRLFKFEFQFRADRSFAKNFDQELDNMVRDHELVLSTFGIAPGSGQGERQFRLYVSLLRTFLESYRIAARGLGALLRGPLSSKEIMRRLLAAGQRMFLSGEISRREAINRPSLENALRAFQELGFVEFSESKYGLSATYSTASAVRTIESRLVSFLPEPPPQAPTEKRAGDDSSAALPV